MALLRAVEYHLPLSCSGLSVFQWWEQGVAVNGMSTPSIFNPDYREFVVNVILGYACSVGPSVLSLGCGIGVTEEVLQRRGLRVLATDVNGAAVKLARDKGLDARVIDAIQPGVCGLKFDMVYCDGLMGHMWDTVDRYDRFLANVSAVLDTRGVLIASNDLSDCLTSYSTGVTGHANSGFFRGSVDYMRMVTSRVNGLHHLADWNYQYNRPSRGRRWRQVSVMSFGDSHAATATRYHCSTIG